VSKYVLSTKLAVFSTETSKLLSAEAIFLAQNASQAVWWPGSARTDWWSLQRSSRLPSWIKGCPPGRRGKRRKKGRDGVGEEWGKGGRRRGRKTAEGEMMEEGKGGEEKGRENRVGEGKLVRDCADLKIPFKKPWSWTTR